MGVNKSQNFADVIQVSSLGAGQHVHECAARAPGELVSEGVVRGLGGGEPAAVRLEHLDAAASVVYLLYQSELISFSYRLLVEVLQSYTNLSWIDLDLGSSPLPISPRRMAQQTPQNVTQPNPNL